MPGMAPNKVIRTVITPEMREAIAAYCAEHGLELSELVREAVLRRIGRRDLIETMPTRGQPRKTAE